ncbi:MAG: agmatine deiminase family protein [Xanthomonadales bacterium]|nr:agmatine deiminase family protein [Xanthomonadales bacterium]
MSIRFPAEWEPQSATLLAWPYEGSDWDPVLRYVQNTYRQIIAAARQYQPVVLLVPDDDLIEDEFWLPVEGVHPVHILNLPYDDTFVRHCGPLTVHSGTAPMWADFRFDGLGGRYFRPRDAEMVSALTASGLFHHLNTICHPWVLEGGAVESDGAGTLMTTSRCLGRRVSRFTRRDWEEQLKRALGAERVLWLDHGELLGEDNDGHVDTLARFADPDTIIYQGCRRPEDPHYPFLCAMADQLRGFRNTRHQRYDLIELPLPAAPATGETPVPASYASFAILNDAVLMPTFNDPENDPIAVRIIERAFPGRTVVPIDSRVLVSRGSGIHSATLQLPLGVLT